jgi:hypothetical protein
VTYGAGRMLLFNLPVAKLMLLFLFLMGRYPPRLPTCIFVYINRNMHCQCRFIKKKSKPKLPSKDVLKISCTISFS